MNRFNVQKPLMTIGIVAIALGGIVWLILFMLPVAAVFGESRLPANVSVLESARAAAGKALINTGRGVNILSWRWCPASGLNVFCFQSSGSSGFLQGKAAIRYPRTTIGELRFSRLRPEAIGLGGLAAGTSLDGSLTNVVFDWRDGCPHRGLITARGEVRLSGPAAGGGPVTIEGNGEDSVELRGNPASGRLQLAPDRITGRLRVAVPGAPGGGYVDVNVARGVSCL